MSEESDSEEHYYSGSEGGDESHDSDSDDANHGLLDLEASEASSEPGSDDYDDQSSDYDSYLEHFPKFMQLPPEIREMVWDAFCPDLEAEARVLELRLRTAYTPEGPLSLPETVIGIVPGPHLEDQTAPMRALLAVHRESRALGLKAAPHELSLSRGELVRYHEERDVLYIDWSGEIIVRGMASHFQELGISARNLAIGTNLIYMQAEFLVDLVYLLPQIKTLFFLDEDEDLHDQRVSPRDYAWVGAGQVHKYRIDVDEEWDHGFVMPVSRIFCWPDLDNYGEFAKENIEKSDENPWWRDSIGEGRRRLGDPLADSNELNEDDFPDDEKMEAINRIQNIEIWPMVRFNFTQGLHRFNKMEAWYGRWSECSVSDSEDSNHDTEDEYESDGIDDGPIDDSTSTDDDEDELLGQYLGHGSSHLHGSSSQLLDNTSDADELPPANFSSDEEIDNRGELDTNTSGSEDEEGPQIQATRPKRRVVESDSDESATETEDLSGPSKRHARVVLVDSDDEGGSSELEPVRAANRRARTLPTDSEDENDQDEDEAPHSIDAVRKRGRAITIDSDVDNDDEQEVQQPSRGKRRRARVVQAESDEEDGDGESDSQGGGAKTQVTISSDEENVSSDGEEDDDPPPPKRMSLANRLRMESQQNRPRHLDEDDVDSEARDAAGDGFGYSDDEEDGMDGSEGGMLMGMAEEYEGEAGESEDDY
ncbi:hypothetical protein Daus18300_008263 [Diaporthe australafricana]|uniref:2EXR domain-containing protein n=1 Tax=Diaporthe australafricana TaxID=127596 RepID=A0ABR3WJB2_9PEZI